MQDGIKLEGDPLAQLQDAVERSPQAVKSEFDSTPNDWLRCFASRMFVIETLLNTDRAKESLPKQEHAAAHAKLDQLKTRVVELREQYTGKTNMPPDALQQELFDALDILG